MSIRLRFFMSTNPTGLYDIPKTEVSSEAPRRWQEDMVGRNEGAVARGKSPLC